jgi:deoxyribonuclease V
LRRAWDPRKPTKLKVGEAVALQKELAQRVITRSELPDRLSCVAGFDAAYSAGRTIVAAALLSYPSLEPEELAVVRLKTPFPYVPGLLGFREVPGALRALGKLRGKPDVCLADGHGVAHPRKCGFASLLGLYSGIPTIGVAKSHLYGDIVGDRILDKKGEEIGRVIRPAGKKSLYVSVGHKLSLDDAIRIVQSCITEEGLKPIVIAHREVSKRKWSPSK